MVLLIPPLVASGDPGRAVISAGPEAARQTVYGSISRPDGLLWVEQSGLRVSGCERGTGGGRLPLRSGAADRE